MIRYGFNIRTKTGQRVDNIQIMASTLNDAERRLMQMYLNCEIIDRREQSVRAAQRQPRPRAGHQPHQRRRFSSRSRTH